jgi:ribosome-associated translation inhibitor RaiA
VLDKIERQLRKVHDKRIFSLRREAQRDPPKRRN